MWVGRPMRVTLGWARCADNVADILRRGAWYPIVEESADGHVVVEVRQQRVRLSHLDDDVRSEEHTSELQSLAYLVCRLLLEKKKKDISRKLKLNNDTIGTLEHSSETARE